MDIKSVTEAGRRAAVHWNKDKDAAFLRQWTGRNYNFPLTEEQILNKEKEGVRIFQFEENGEIVGTISILYTKPEEGYAYVGCFLVNPALQGKGLGTKAIEKIKELCAKEGFREVRLCVFDFNLGAKRCYEKAGFVEIDRQDRGDCFSLYLSAKLTEEKTEPFLIMLRGNSGSGKSCVSKELQKLFGRGTLLIPQDVVRREMLYVRDEDNNKAIPLLIQLLTYGREHCKAVILEGILSSDKYKPVFEAAERLFKERIFAYYYDLPFEETLKRHQTKNNKADFGEQEMRDWWREKDLIGFLPEKILTKELSISDVVKQIQDDVLLH